MHTTCSTPMCGFLLALLAGLTGLQLLKWVVLILYCARGEACDHFLCSHVGGVLCHTCQGHIPSPTVHVLILIHRVGDRTVGPAQQAANTTLMSISYSAPSTRAVTQQLTANCIELQVVVAHTCIWTTFCKIPPLKSLWQQ